MSCSTAATWLLSRAIDLLGLLSPRGWLDWTEEWTWRREDAVVIGLSKVDAAESNL